MDGRERRCGGFLGRTGRLRANESFALAKAAWVNDGGTVDEDYYRQQIKVVDERLALAGLRQAALLNEVLGRVSPQEFRH